MKHRLFMAAIGSSLLLAACEKNNEGAGNKSANVTCQITTTERSSQLGTANTTGSTGSANRTDGITITWTGGYVTTSEIKFEAKGDDNKVEFKSKAVQQIDLFDAVATIGSIPVVPGTYEKIE